MGRASKALQRLFFTRIFSDGPISTGPLLDVYNSTFGEDEALESWFSVQLNDLAKSYLETRPERVMLLPTYPTEMRSVLMQVWGLIRKKVGRDVARYVFGYIHTQTPDVAQRGVTTVQRMIYKPVQKRMFTFSP